MQQLFHFFAAIFSQEQKMQFFLLWQHPLPVPVQLCSRLLSQFILTGNISQYLLAMCHKDTSKALNILKAFLFLLLFWRGQKWQVLIHIYFHAAYYGAKSRLRLQKIPVTIIVLPTLLSHCRDGTAPQSSCENIKQSIYVHCSSSLCCFARSRRESSTCKVMYSDLLKHRVLLTFICLNCNKCVTTGSYSYTLWK